MNLKSKTDMQEQEFEDRQGRFEFFCREALKIIEQFAADCKAGWNKLFKTIKPRFENLTHVLPFSEPLH